MSAEVSVLNDRLVVAQDWKQLQKPRLDRHSDGSKGFFERFSLELGLFVPTPHLGAAIDKVGFSLRHPRRRMRSRRLVNPLPKDGQ